MFIAFLIMLREDFEAALIVAILASYMAQSGRSASLPSLWMRVIAAIAASATLAIVITISGAEFPQQEQEIFAGCVGLVAVAMLVGMVFWMRKAGRTIKQELQSKVDAAFLVKDSGWNLALAVSAFLINGREGVESVVFLIATLQQSVGWSVPAGALLRLVGAAALARSEAGFTAAACSIAHTDVIKLNLRQRASLSSIVNIRDVTTEAFYREVNLGGKLHRLFNC